MNIFQAVDGQDEFKGYFIVAENETEALGKLYIYLKRIYSDVDEWFKEYRVFQLKENYSDGVYGYY
jgi:hypothetical protein